MLGSELPSPDFIHSLFNVHAHLASCCTHGTLLNVACFWVLREVSDQYMGFQLKWVWLRPSTWVLREWINSFIHSFIPLRTPASSRPERNNFLSDQTKPHVTSGRKENIFREDFCKIRLLRDIRDWQSIRLVCAGEGWRGVRVKHY